MQVVKLGNHSGWCHQNSKPHIDNWKTLRLSRRSERHSNSKDVIKLMTINELQRLPHTRTTCLHFLASVQTKA